MQEIKRIGTYIIKQVRKGKFIIVIGHQLRVKIFTGIFTCEIEPIELETINKMKSSYQS